MTALKDLAQRRARRLSHERGRRRLRYGIGLGTDMTPDDLAFDPGGAVDVAEAEPEPLAVPLGERVIEPACGCASCQRLRAMRGERARAVD